MNRNQWRRCSIALLNLKKNDFGDQEIELEELNARMGPLC